MRRAVSDLFERYARETNRALTGEPDLGAITDLYADSFVGSSPAGVLAGKKDEGFAKALASGLARQREIGARRMTVLEVRVEPIDAIHALAHAVWRAIYEVRATRKEIDFTNVYLIRTDDDVARVFGWITGDEEAVLRKHGLID